MGRGHNNKWREKSNKNDDLVALLDRLSNQTAVQPNERLRLETTPDETTGRIVDLITPLGKGQRVLLPSPPKAGKTTILQKIAKAVDKNFPDVRQYALLIDERVEEVTDFKRNIPAEVRASSIDQHPKNHVETAEKAYKDAIEDTLRGKDVLILLDSLTRLGRTYNKVVKHSGRTLSGGLSANALNRPRQLFGTARNIENGGSLTVVASTLIDTGSRMDEVIFQEFKGTGNAELVLDRELAEHRLWPAVDIDASGTRQEAKIMTDLEYRKISDLRRRLAGMDKKGALKWLQDAIRDTETNEELLENV